MIIAPEAEPDDGYFDLVLVEDMKKFEIIKNSRHLYTGAITTHPKVIVKRARNIKVYPEQEDGSDNEANAISIEYDGELGRAVPAEFQVLEKSVNFRI